MLKSKIKNIILFTVLISSISLPSAFADIHFDTKGNITSLGSILNQDIDSSNFDFSLNGFADLRLYYETLSGKKHGAVLQINSQDSYNFQPYDNDYIEQAYLFTQTSVGMFELGLLKNIGEKLSISAPNISPLTISDNRSLLFDTINVPSNFSILTTTAPDFAQESLRLNYITPKSKGWQLGLMVAKGTDRINNSKTPSINKDDFSYGLGISSKFKHDFSNDKSISASFAYSFYDDTRVNGYSYASSLQEISAGTNFSFNNFTIGGGFKKVIESRERNGFLSQEGQAFNFGLAYNFTNYWLSFAYHNSQTNGIAGNNIKDESELFIASIAKNNFYDIQDLQLSFSTGFANYQRASLIENDGFFATVGLKWQFNKKINLSEIIYSEEDYDYEDFDK